MQDAFDILLNGDGALHDRRVKQAILELAPRVDVIVLGQASMVRVLDTFAPGECPVPILTSPHAALAQVKKNLQSGLKILGAPDAADYTCTSNFSRIEPSLCDQPIYSQVIRLTVKNTLPKPFGLKALIIGPPNVPSGEDSVQQFVRRHAYRAGERLVGYPTSKPLAVTLATTCQPRLAPEKKSLTSGIISAVVSLPNKIGRIQDSRQALPTLCSGAEALCCVRWATGGSDRLDRHSTAPFSFYTYGGRKMDYTAKRPTRKMPRKIIARASMGAMPAGGMPLGEMSGSGTTMGKMATGQMPRGEMMPRASMGAMPAGGMPLGEMSGSGTTMGKMATGQMPRGEMMPRASMGAMPAGGMPLGEMSGSGTTMGKMATGQMPRGEMMPRASMGAMPAGGMPLGEMSGSGTTMGKMATGQMPRAEMLPKSSIGEMPASGMLSGELSVNRTTMGKMATGEMPSAEMLPKASVSGAESVMGKLPYSGVAKSQSSGSLPGIELPGSWRITLSPASKDKV